LFLFFGLLGACQDPANETREDSEDFVNESDSLIVPVVSDTTITYNLERFNVSVQIKMPETEFKGTILVLQGWNFPNTNWSDSSDLDNLASKAGYALVMPDMGKSIYHKRNYPVTRRDWRKYPTRTWLVDTLIDDLQRNYNLLMEGEFNFVMGLSTGGRGAFILAQENPEIFKAGASLSGDYDQSAFPSDNLYRGYFGSNPENWNDDENPVSSVDTWSVPMYILHGTEDRVVSIKHMLLLRELQRDQNPELPFSFKQVNVAGHNYTFWAAEVAPILQYFQEF
jgi:S-formylglutathione hydrolase FrmB